MTGSIWCRSQGFQVTSDCRGESLGNRGTCNLFNPQSELCNQDGLNLRSSLDERVSYIAENQIEGFRSDNEPHSQSGLRFDLPTIPKKSSKSNSSSSSVYDGVFKRPLSKKRKLITSEQREFLEASAWNLKSFSDAGQSSITVNPIILDEVNLKASKMLHSRFSDITKRLIREVVNTEL